MEEILVFQFVCNLCSIFLALSRNRKLKYVQVIYRIVTCLLFESRSHECRPHSCWSLYGKLSDVVSFLPTTNAEFLINDSLIDPLPFVSPIDEMMMNLALISTFHIKIFRRSIAVAEWMSRRFFYTASTYLGDVRWRFTFKRLSPTEWRQNQLDNRNSENNETSLLLYCPLLHMYSYRLLVFSL